MGSPAPHSKAPPTRPRAASTADRAPMFFFSSALYPLWKLREGGSEALYYVALANPFTHAVELIRFALYGDFEMTAAAVVGASTVVFFLLAVFGYNPQRGMIRRAPQPA